MIMVNKGGMMFMKITYTTVGDYQLPNLQVKEVKTNNLGKYSMMRLQYLKEHKKPLYQKMLMKGTLTTHLEEIEMTSQERLEMIINQMKVQLNITEEMKTQDQMKWVGLMNNIKSQAEETIMNELIYC